jgi:hypothetical protein
LVDLDEYQSVVPQTSISLDDTRDQNQDNLARLFPPFIFNEASDGEVSVALPLITWTPCTPQNSEDGNSEQANAPTLQEDRLTVPLFTDDEPFEAETEAHTLPKLPKAETHEHKQTHSTSLLRRFSESVGKFIVAHSNADIVHSNAYIVPTAQPMMHPNASILDHDLQSPDRGAEQSQHGASMPVLADGPEVRKNKRSGPFGKLRGVFDRKSGSDEEGEEVKKESLARKLSRRIKAFI